MKVFFTASQRGKKYFLKNYEKIYEIVKKKGYKILDDDLLSMPADSFYEKYKPGKRDLFEKFYNNELKNLRDSDINIFDCSFHSLSIGFIVEKSINLSKPTIVLYKKDFEPFFLNGITEEKFIIKEYTDSNLNEIVVKALDEALDLRDKRFNFFISPDLLNYVKAESRKQGVTMSVFLRGLILKHKNADR